MNLFLFRNCYLDCQKIWQASNLPIAHFETFGLDTTFIIVSDGSLKYPKKCIAAGVEIPHYYTSNEDIYKYKILSDLKGSEGGPK